MRAEDCGGRERAALRAWEGEGEKVVVQKGRGLKREDDLRLDAWK